MSKDKFVIHLGQHLVNIKGRVSGRYFDEYEKRDDVWKFSSRAVDADWAYVNDPSMVNLIHPMIEGANIGAPDEGDPSYKYLKAFNDFIKKHREISENGFFARGCGTK